MKEKIKAQRGFIQIPLLLIIIASIAIASVGAGIVLYKQEKLSSITDNIFRGFGRNKEIKTTKELEPTAIPTEKEVVSNPKELNKTENNIAQTQDKEKSDLCADIHCSDYQHCESGNCIAYCNGLDANCGCTSCVNCNDLDGWVDSGHQYSYCDESLECIWQGFGQEYRDYSCSKTTCVYSVTDAQIISKDECIECGPSEVCAGGACKEKFETQFYSAMTIGDFVHQVGYFLTNNSPQAITVTKVEFFDKNGDIQHTVSESALQETLHKGYLSAGNTFNWNVSFQIPYSTAEVKEWQAKWYCRDSNGSPFTVTGSYSSLLIPSL